MNTQFLVSGMFRSGTTMLARMLHANPNIVCASDPFAPIFKSYRNMVATDLNGSCDPDAPLHDYYLDRVQNALFQEIQKRGFAQPVATDEVVALRERIKHHCPPYSPLIVPHLAELGGVTYAELFDSALDMIRKVYGKQGAQAVGFKEVWIDEFTPLFRKLNPGNKIIHLIRDPRSVVASNFASGSTYPLIFLIRQWRKIVTLAWHNADHSADVKLVRFEYLLSDPETVAKDLCEFLEVDFHENMTDPSSYTDGAGQPWHQNTSYRKDDKPDGERRFNSSALDKWKQVLSDDVVALIDLFCSWEMALLGYEAVSDIKEARRSPEMLDYEDDPTTCAEWIKPYATYNYIKDILAELQRLALIESQQVLSEQSKRLLTLEPGMFEVLGRQRSGV